jgi:hypothetical protein
MAGVDLSIRDPAIIKKNRKAAEKQLRDICKIMRSVHGYRYKE